MVKRVAADKAKPRRWPGLWVVGAGGGLGANAGATEGGLRPCGCAGSDDLYQVAVRDRSTRVGDPDAAGGIHNGIARGGDLEARSEAGRTGISCAGAEVDEVASSGEVLEQDVTA